ncbi:Uncharacterised protein [Vibrio cholerae]|nr:Uncharacterised protein [Vibrio cholerae]CSC59301.1 Uncharacterised protein [Vibrio cholerae]
MRVKKFPVDRQHAAQVTTVSAHSHAEQGLDNAPLAPVSQYFHHLPHPAVHIRFDRPCRLHGNSAGNTAPTDRHSGSTHDEHEPRSHPNQTHRVHAPEGQAELANPRRRSVREGFCEKDSELIAAQSGDRDRP